MQDNLYNKSTFSIRTKLQHYKYDKSEKMRDETNIAYTYTYCQSSIQLFISMDQTTIIMEERLLLQLVLRVHWALVLRQRHRQIVGVQSVQCHDCRILV
jgi:hypothetical protein